MAKSFNFTEVLTSTMQALEVDSKNKNVELAENKGKIDFIKDILEFFDKNNLEVVQKEETEEVKEEVKKENE